MNLNTQKHDAGAGFIQLVAAVAVIGIIAAISLNKMTNLGERAEETRLKEHVQALNSSVKLYISSGGTIDQVASAQQVISKLKTQAANGKSIPGFRGNFIDYRLKPVEQTPEEAATDGELRVLWDGAAREFRIARNGSKGIKTFELDPSVTPETLEVEERSAFFELAANEDTEGSWVWDYDKDASVTDSSIVSVGLPSTAADIDPSASTQSKEQLLQPTVSPAPGEYPLSEYGEAGKTITISNPNNISGEVSETYVSVNGEIWEAVDDNATLQVPPGANVATFANVKEGYTTSYYNSYVRSAKFEGTKTTNTTPNISSSASSFNPVSQPSVTVVINHSNDPTHVKPQYQINDGSWEDYIAPVTLNIADHIEGVTVKTKAVGIEWPEYYEASSEAQLEISTSQHVLESPTLASSPSVLHPLDSPNIVFTAGNPNETLGDISKLQYSINGGDWLDYTGPATINIDDYSDGATIAAKSIPTALVGAFVDSEVASINIEAMDVNLQAPSIATSYAKFHPFGRKDITVTLTNPNSQDVSEMVYSLDGGNEWAAYGGSISLNWQNHLNGVTVSARATPTVHPNNLLSSQEATVVLEMESAQLVAPEIASSIPNVNDAGQIEALISITDSNPGGFSNLVYSLDSEATWEVYDGPFAITFPDYPSNQRVIAKCEPAKNPEVIQASSATNLDIDAGRPTLPPPVVTFTGELATNHGHGNNYDGVDSSNPSGGDGGPNGEEDPSGMYDDEIHQGFYKGAVTITIEPAQTFPEEAVIYYTLDGSEPSASSGTVYTGPIEMNYRGRRRSLDSHMVKAISISTANPSVYLPSEIVTSSASMVDPTEVQTFDGGSSARFTDAITLSNNTKYDIEPNYFEWGRADQGYVESYLDYEGTTITDIAENTYFEIGTLTYHNGLIYQGDVSNVTFNVDVSFGGLGLQQSFAFDFGLINTENSLYNTADENADYVKLGNTADEFSITLDNGKLYELELQFGYLGSNGFTTVDQFHVHEGKGATATLFGKFVEDLDYDGIW